MPLTSAQKQHRRRKALDEIAASVGYSSHYKMLTAIINGEAKVTKMKTSFATKRDAVEAGFRGINKQSDKDASGPNEFGYVWENQDGERTVSVWIKDAKNAGGGRGAVIPMYPPK